MTHASDRINEITCLNKSKFYLEIGVADGSTFREVKIPHRTGVDISFRFDTQLLADQNTYFFTQRSDDFFGSIDMGIPGYPTDIQWDLVFIDGLHTFEQAMRDFTNTFNHCHSKTIWIFDDTIPSDPWSTLLSFEKTKRLRSLAGLNSPAWHGDVFKCVFALHDLYPDFSYATIYDKGNPQTVAWRTNWISPRQHVFPGMEAINNLTYFDMLEHLDLFNLQKDCEFIGKIGSHFISDIRNSEELQPLVVKHVS